MVKSEGHNCVSSNSLPHFSIRKKFSKLFIYLGLVINGASLQQLLRNSDSVTGTRMYNRLHKLINELREQKKMVEKKGP